MTGFYGKPIALTIGATAQKDGQKLVIWQKVLKKADRQAGLNLSDSKSLFIASMMRGINKTCLSAGFRLYCGKSETMAVGFFKSAFFYACKDD